MSIEVIKQQIESFLSSDTPEVLAIKGAWGIGKTYSWKKFLNESKANDKISLEKYSYVSLFGINSLETFKYEIFQNIIEKKLIGVEADVGTFTSNTSSLGNLIGRKSFSFFKELPGVKDFSTAIESLAYLSVSKIIICIDDLERKGSELSIKDILGLISQLKEQKKCKIVLLLNEGEEGLEDYVKYREKVIDLELEFAPSASECASIAYDNKTEPHIKLSKFTEILDIKNIRVLKKIERLVDLVLPYAINYEDEIRHQFIHSLTLFSWCYFKVDKGGPTLEFVTNLGYSFYGIGDDKDESDEHKKWKTLLEKYGYQHTDELDLVLAEAVRTGYFVEDNLKLAATKKNEQIIASKSDNSFSEAWNLYHDTFANNQNEVIGAIYESFKNNAQNITPTNLNGTVSLFRELGEQEKASEIIDFYINLRSDEIDLFDPEKHHFFGDTIDQEVLKKFEVAYSKLVTTEGAKQTVERLAGQNGWNQKDEVILANTTVEEYYNLFKSETGRQLSSYVRACLQFGQFANPTEQHALIAKKAREALLIIAGESEINRRRVKKFGIELNKT